MKLVIKMQWSDDPADVTTILRGFNDFNFYISYTPSIKEITGPFTIDSAMDKLWAKYYLRDDPDLLNKMDEIHKTMVEFKLKNKRKD